MVVKRTCSFCAGEIEPGTGSMFVKRDGTVYHFCTSSCRKQQLHLGRVGHRLKWTRAHALRKATEQAGSRAAGPKTTAAPPAPKATAKPETPAAAETPAEKPKKASRPRKKPAATDAPPSEAPASG